MKLPRLLVTTFALLLVTPSALLHAQDQQGSDSDTAGYEVELFQTLYRAGRVQRRAVQFSGYSHIGQDGREELRSALDLARRLYGPESEEAGLVLMELGRPILRRTDAEIDPRLRASIGERFRVVFWDEDSLERAQDILSNYPGRRLEVTQMQVMTAFKPLNEDDQYRARNILDPAFTRLLAAGYADDMMVAAFVALGSYRIPRMTRSRRERALQELFDYAMLRDTGGVFLLYRPHPDAPTRTTNGTWTINFTITEEGLLSNIRVVHANPPELREHDASELYAAIRFVPRMYAAEAVSQPNMSMGIRFWRSW